MACHSMLSADSHRSSLRQINRRRLQFFLEKSLELTRAECLERSCAALSCGSM